MYEKNEVHVDTKNFKVSYFLVDLFKNHRKSHSLSPSYWFTNIVFLMATYFTWRFLRRPIEKYYHWDDPLKPDDSTPTVSAKVEDIRERLRYKRKVSDWQTQQKANTITTTTSELDQFTILDFT